MDDEQQTAYSGAETTGWRFGRGMVRQAVSGVERRWAAKAEHVSPRYTTRLEELATIQA